MSNKKDFCGTSALEHVRARGFMTGVFDLPHEAHFRLLKAAREQCDYLIVGLTTDERCIQEKRKPVMSYEQRRSILENSKWVDLVVANGGETKQIMLERLNFSILFTTDEYIARPEFTSFKSDYPNVQVIAFPVMGKTHTSDIIRQFENDVINSIKILCIGVSGPIYEINRKDTKLIIKPINVGFLESEEIFKDSNSIIMPCSNIYELPFPLPRNWKKIGDLGNKPNITGVNACREIAIIKHIQKYKWNSVIECRQMLSDISRTRPKTSLRTGGPVLDSEPRPLDGDLVNLDSIKSSGKTFVGTVTCMNENAYLLCNKERQNPSQVYWLFQERCDSDFYDWIISIYDSLPMGNDGTPYKSDLDKLYKVLVKICYQIKKIVTYDLIPSGIIHGDLHMKNIGLRYNTDLFNDLNDPLKNNPENYIRLLDWGWCMHYSFDMHRIERSYYDECLHDAFDWRHFVDSVEYDLIRMDLLDREFIDKLVLELRKK